MMPTASTFDELAQRWTEAVGAQIAKVCRPYAFVLTSGTLYVVVDTQQWVDELGRLTNDVLARLPQEIDGVRVRGIRWVGASRHVATRPLLKVQP